jgi:Bacterial protein of unknown function (DUF885)
MNARRVALSCVLVSVLLAHEVRAADNGWVARSNQNTQVALDAIASVSPEEASFMGVESVDSNISDLTPGATERYVQALTAARNTLAERAAGESDPAVRADLNIVVGSCDLRVESARTSDRLLREYAQVGQTVFYGEFALLSDQVSPERRNHALDRLKKYVGLEKGYKPATELAMALYEASASDPKRLAPYKGEVEHDLEGLESYPKGIRSLFKKYGITGGDEALNALDAQFKVYGEWLRSKVLPGAREDFRLPPEMYALRLREVGLEIDPQSLIREARIAFAGIQGEMASVAAQVAKERGYPRSDYRSVIAELKKEQLAQAEVEAFYRDIIARMDPVIRAQRIVAMPDRPLRMRLASEAETAALPAPHYMPPRLIGNRGEQGEFILPLAVSAKDTADKFDDFTFKAAAWTLTAHEGRPGHDLQFAAMLERGVSLARSIFARNSVNVEGWALYAESEYKPYEPLEGQLIALQLRLQRAARAVLDPMLNLGLISKARAHDILRDDVCLSEAFTKEELDRFTYDSPGQATAYFFGYTRIMEMRAEAELALGKKFDRYAFNTFLIDQGLLPPSQLAEAVRTQFIPKYQ